MGRKVGLFGFSLIEARWLLVAQMRFISYQKTVGPFSAVFFTCYAYFVRRWHSCGGIWIITLGKYLELGAGFSFFGMQSFIVSTFLGIFMLSFSEWR